MKSLLFTFCIAALCLTGCGGPATEETASVETVPTTEDGEVPAPMRNFSALTIGPYEVQPMYEEEIPDGHYNINVSNGEFNAVRIWVGKEDPADVMIVKTEVENDYQHGHLDIPDPIPADYRLWIEIEAPDGELYKGSVPLKPAN